MRILGFWTALMYDFCIIGGGVAGLSLAAALSAQAKVAVLEAEDSFAYHASGRSAALFIRDYGNTVVRRLNAFSEPVLMSIDAGVLSPRGLMMVVRHGEESAFATEAAGFGLDHISLTEACAMVPILDHAKLSRAGYTSGPADIDTDRLLQAYIRIARQNSAQLFTKARVLQSHWDRNQWHVKTHHDTYQARIVINAAGAWADGIARLCQISPIGLVPHRRSIARVPINYDCTTWPALDGVNETWYAKPDAGQLLISPADETPVTPHDAWADDLTIAQGIDQFQSVITPEITRLTATWAGLRTFAPDRSLVIGRASDNPNFFWLAGQGGYGFHTAPAASQLAAELLLGLKSSFEPDLIAALSPERFSQ